jgi:hypothetical protein
LLFFFSFIIHEENKFLLNEEKKIKWFFLFAVAPHQEVPPHTRSSEGRSKLERQLVDLETLPLSCF